MITMRVFYPREVCVNIGKKYEIKKKTTYRIYEHDVFLSDVSFTSMTQWWPPPREATA